MKDDEFIKTMTLIEKNAWLSFKDVVEKFLENNRDPQFRTIVSTMLQNFRRLGCLLSMKIHFIKYHADYFLDNAGSFSGEMGERFHRNLHQKEQHYQNRWNENMMTDYCWLLNRENKNAMNHKRKSLQRSIEMEWERSHKK